MTTKLKNTVNKLRDLLANKNAVLQVQHSRIMVGGGAIDNTNTIDYCLTKKEYYEAVKNNRFVTFPSHQVLTEDEATIANIDYGDFVHPCGGFTKITLTFPDGSVVTGKKNFHPNEPFVKRLGVAHAIKDALRHVKF